MAMIMIIDSYLVEDHLFDKFEFTKVFPNNTIAI